MNEKGANIDLLFRNGLKDFEVLPPPGVWDGIHSSIKTKSRPIILLRIAAVVTVLLALSFLTYRWSRGLSVGPSGPVIAFNVPVSLPVISSPVDNLQYLPAKKYNQLNNSSDILIETDDQAPFRKKLKQQLILNKL
jgi:hypothetical protein